jgi:hypothetical protein
MESRDSAHDFRVRRRNIVELKRTNSMHLRFASDKDTLYSDAPASAISLAYKIADLI